MLDAALKTQLQAYLTKVTRPVEIVASLDDGDTSRQMRELLQEIASLSRSHLVERDDGAERKPSFRSPVRARHRHPLAASPRPRIHLAGAGPAAGRRPSAQGQRRGAGQIRDLDGEFNFVTYISLSCQNCPEVVQSLNLMALLNPKIRHETVDGALFQDEVTRLQIMAVPTILLNGQEFGQGAWSSRDPRQGRSGAEARAAAKIAAREPSTCWWWAAGRRARRPRSTPRARASAPAWSPSASAARCWTPGHRELHLGEGDRRPAPRRGAGEHVKQYDVDIMNLQRAEALVPGELIEVKLASGASLRSKTVILSTGARWRDMNVPGETEYRTKGVTYCPHCDGPLFKGKRWR
jgi:alkyl hydroperoxide reductase subunit F